MISNETITNGDQLTDNTMLGYMMQRATLQTNVQEQPYFTQAFSSSNRYVYLFKVNYVTATKIQMRPIQTPIKYGQNVTIAGNLTDLKGNPLGPVLSVDVESSRNQGQTWDVIQTIPVSEKGAFNYTWKPPGGSYYVRAHYLGLETAYVPSASDPVALVVEGATVTLSVKASTTNVTLGQNVTFSWKMDPYIPDANVTLFYTFDNKTFVPITSVIMTSPTMEYTWKVSVSGTFTIVVGFRGDQNYSPAVSNPIIMKAA